MIEVSQGSLIDTLTQLKNEGFRVLMDLTAVDFVENIAIYYLLHNPDTLQRKHIVCHINDSLPTVTHLWKGADWYERELYDMFGLQVIGHPDLKRILMPDDWKGHPMKRSYALTEESVEFKHGVKPKVPSEIIPYVKTQRPPLFR